MKIKITGIITLLLSFAHTNAQNPDFQLFNMSNTSTFRTNAFTTIGIGKDGFIYAGTQRMGLYRFSPLVFAWEELPLFHNLFINDIKPDKNGGIWIAQSGQPNTVPASNLAGGINYFPSPYGDSSFYSNTPGGGLTSRNVQSLWVDTNRVNVLPTLPKIWAAQGTYVSAGSARAGGISVGLNATTDYFTKVTNGLQVFPYVNSNLAGLPICISIGGNKDECWVGVRQNFNKSQILRYHPLSSYGTFLGVYDNTNVPELPAGFRANAIYFDSEGRQWIGLASGGVVVKEGAVWTSVNMISIFPPGTTVNFNAITGDDEGNIYIGTTNGLVIYSGGTVSSSGSYELLTNSDGLPSNNITGIAADIKNSRILLASTNGVAIWKKNKRITVNLVWDNSFPITGPKPKGVVADGVSRLYMKIRRANDTIPVYKDVEVSIKSFDGSKSTLFGRLKKADTLLLSKYTNEANSGTGTQVNRTDSTSKGEYWFWYVAPEDFSLTSTSIYSHAPERKDTVKVKVTYMNNTKDSVNFLVRVVRPPTVLVHGLASYPEAWDAFSHTTNIPFVSSNLFKHIHAMKMDGRAAFIQNAITMIGGDLPNTPPLSSLQGNIDEIRKKGFAANQADYVCHSMGGIMLRSVIRYRADKYYADDAAKYKYNNYGKGFVHKLITINTPHHGSPVGDAVHQFLPEAPAWIQEPLYQFYIRYPDLPMPFDFVLPDNSSAVTKFDASPAVSNLSVAKSAGGIKMIATPVKYHMIAGDVDLISGQTASTLADLDKYFDLLIKVLEAARAILPPPTKNTLTGILNLTTLARGPAFLEWYSAQKTFPNFLGDGDLVVPLASQLARQSETLPHITKFYNTSGINAWHSGMLSRPDVGERVLDLLNTNLSNIAFADIIPANGDDEPGVVSRPSMPMTPVSLGPTLYDTSKIVITSPLRAAGIFADSTLQVQFRLKDTVNLAYIKIHFQNTDSLVFQRSSIQQVTMKADPAFGGSQQLWAMAIYDKPAGTTAYIDTLSLSVSNLATLQGLRVTPEVSEQIAGTPFYPHYEVKYSNAWVGLPANDNNIQVTIDPPTMVTYDALLNTFTPQAEGFAQAFIQYNGFRDTISINCTLPVYYNCVNTTISGGSFKNPAIWSKGVVPGICDSLIVSAGHTVTIDTSITCRAVRINNGGTLTINNAGATLNIGQPDDGANFLDNYGTLNILNGTIAVQGRIKFYPSGTFNMTGGKLMVDGNTGINETAMPEGLFLFEAAPGMQSFNFTGGILEIVDPPLGTTSQAISCPYNFGINSTLSLGNGISTTPSNNPDGFGGSLFPSTIGKLIINGTIKTGNRQFVNKKALTVQGSCEVKAGSGLVLKAPINVVQ
ncbi:MAG: hypothetical protein H7Z13_08365 [Ferruginibacter sp.]|nr:hypothetical protein [Ferruginibacter sp.]